jgi:hypothetical protein
LVQQISPKVAGHLMPAASRHAVDSRGAVPILIARLRAISLKPRPDSNLNLSMSLVLAHACSPFRQSDPPYGRSFCMGGHSAARNVQFHLPGEDVPGRSNTIPGRPKRLSASARNRVQLHSGMAFRIRPESCPASSRNRVQLRPDSPLQMDRFGAAADQILEGCMPMINMQRPPRRCTTPLPPKAEA